MNRQEFIQRSLRSAANAQAYSYSEMLAQRARQPAFKRVAKVLFGKTVQPLIPRRLNMAGQEYRLYSAGGQQVVYSSDTAVAKLIIDSLSFDKDYTEATAGDYQVRHDSSLPFLGEHTTPTAFDLRRFKGGLFASIALQPRLRPQKEFIDVDDLVFYRHDPAYAAELEAFWQSLTALHAATKLQVDLNGPRNLFLMGSYRQPTIKVVDTIMVSPEMQQLPDLSTGLSTGETIRRKMSVLGDAVAIRPIAQTASHAVIAH